MISFLPVDTMNEDDRRMVLEGLAGELECCIRQLRRLDIERLPRHLPQEQTLAYWRARQDRLMTLVQQIKQAAL